MLSAVQQDLESALHRLGDLQDDVGTTLDQRRTMTMSSSHHHCGLTNLRESSRLATSSLRSEPAGSASFLSHRSASTAHLSDASPTHPPSRSSHASPSLLKAPIAFLPTSSLPSSFGPIPTTDKTSRTPSVDPICCGGLFTCTSPPEYRSPTPSPPDRSTPPQFEPQDHPLLPSDEQGSIVSSAAGMKEAGFDETECCFGVVDCD